MKSPPTGAEFRRFLDREVDLEESMAISSPLVRRQATIIQLAIDGSVPRFSRLIRFAAIDALAVLVDMATPLPAATFAYSYGGRTFTKHIGGELMPVSILDTDTGWGVSVGNLRDAAGEAVKPEDVTIAFTVDDTKLVDLTDNGDGSATFGSGLTDDDTADLPASTTLHATVTNKDGAAITLDDVITVVASDAVSGAFTFTPPA